MTHLNNMAQKKLLVADDSITIQKVIRLALANEGYEIQAVSDGKDVIQQLSLFRPDIVLIDVSLPTRTAFEIKEDCNKQDDFKNIRFILMSSAFEKFDENRANAAHFHAKLTKPFDPANLRQILSEASSYAFEATVQPTLKFDAPDSLPEIPDHDELSLASDESDLSSLPPIQPDVPIMTLPLHETTRTLWEPPPLPASSIVEANAPESPESDSDIKQLTASTLKLSGLEELQWGIQEQHKKPSTLPVTPPPPPIAAYTFHEDSDSHFQAISAKSKPDLAASYEPTKTTFSKEFLSEIELEHFDAPPEPTLPVDQKLKDTGDNFTKTREINLPTGASTFDPYNDDNLPPPPPASHDFSRPTADVIPLTVAQMEDVLQKQLQDTIEKMARKLLPDLAERIIKEEIHRMLGE